MNPLYILATGILWTLCFTLAMQLQANDRSKLTPIIVLNTFFLWPLVFIIYWPKSRTFQSVDEKYKNTITIDLKTAEQIIDDVIMLHDVQEAKSYVTENELFFDSPYSEIYKFVKEHQ